MTIKKYSFVYFFLIFFQKKYRPEQQQLIEGKKRWTPTNTLIARKYIKSEVDKLALLSPEKLADSDSLITPYKVANL